MALILAEEEYMVPSQVACEVIWMRKMLIRFVGQMMDPTVIYFDNHNCIKIFENIIFCDQSNHIDI